MLCNSGGFQQNSIDALKQAIENSDINAVELYLKTDPTCCNQLLDDTTKETALHYAMRLEKRGKIVEALLNCPNIDVTIADSDGWLPLHWAIKKEDVSCFQSVLKKEPDTANSKTADGRTALHLAVTFGNKAILAALLSSETTNRNLVNHLHETAAEQAMREGDVGMIALFGEKPKTFWQDTITTSPSTHHRIQTSTTYQGLDQ
jgi:ankyrin repeat protein